MKAAIYFTFILLIALLVPADILAQDPFLSDDEAVELCLGALDGQESAVRGLVREYARYEKRLLRKETLSPSEQDLFAEIEETLLLVSPKTVQNAGYKQVTVRRPDSRKASAPSEDRIFLKPSKDPRSPYFVFNEGEVKIFDGRKKGSDGAWIPSRKTLRFHVLKTQRGRTHFEALVLKEILTHQGQWLAEQAFLTFRVSDEGVRVSAETVFSQPAPGQSLSVGKKPAEWIARFPLAEEDQWDGYRVLSVSSTARTPLKIFRGCLVLAGLTDTWLFDPVDGLVALQHPGELWLLKESRARKTLALDPDFGPDYDRKSLLRSLEGYCERNGLKFDRMLFALPAAAVGRESVDVRMLAHSTDKQEPGQKRYSVIEGRWTRKGEEVSDWVLESENAGFIPPD